MTRTNILKNAALALCVATLAACGTTPSTPVSKGEQTRLDSEVKTALNDFRIADPGLDKFLTTAYGYAIFPDVGSGALIVGGAHGNGAVFRVAEKGAAHFIGYADVSKGDIGPQLGGQSYAQLVLFENQGALAEFTSGKELAFDAKASAVAADKGASRSADYQKGVLVFTRAKGGLMAQAAIGGQKFRFIDAKAADTGKPGESPYGLSGDERKMEPRDSRDIPAWQK